MGLSTTGFAWTKKRVRVKDHTTKPNWINTATGSTYNTSVMPPFDYVFVIRMYTAQVQPTFACVPFSKWQ